LHYAIEDRTRDGIDMAQEIRSPPPARWWEIFDTPQQVLEGMRMHGSGIQTALFEWLHGLDPCGNASLNQYL
jgi:hypothetical protein